MFENVCSVSDNERDDFVGLRFVNGQPRVVFPRGFSLSTGEKEIRRDILRLLTAISKFSGHREGDKVRNTIGDNTLRFPILSYQYVISDFLENGYYTEKEVRYIERPRGKINWKRTIQKEKPQYDGRNVVYLDFVVKTNLINNNNLITRIHEYCVHESFSRIGWLYLSNNLLPPKPRIAFSRHLFLSILQRELRNTFNDQKRLLFMSMINIVKSTAEDGDNHSETAFGVNRFEYVWEGMIDYVFGEDNKERYFPHATWTVIRNGRTVLESSELRPDTIVKVDNKIYILDAKYYKYGITGLSNHLPATDSIQKQITYGDYVHQKGFAETNNIFNAFLLPYCSQTNTHYEVAAIATADWKAYSADTPKYNYVLAILVDTTHLLRSYTKHNWNEISTLTSLIESSIGDYVKSIRR